MNIIFTNSKNSKTPDPHILLCNLTYKIDLKTEEKHFPLSNLSIYYTWKNIKRSYKNNESAPTWNEEFELPDGSCFLSGIKRLLRLLREKTVNPSIRIYINKIENRITFKIKTGYYLEVLTLETIT